MKLMQNHNLGDMLIISLLFLFGEASVAQSPNQLNGADLIVSANDAKHLRVEGRDTYPEGASSDTLTLIDASVFPPKVVTTLDVEHGIFGPPSGVAITPDGRLAIVSSPNRYDHANQELTSETFLQVVDFSVNPARVIQKIELDSHPQGLAINRDGTLLLATTVDGIVAVLGIEGTKVTLIDQLKVAEKRLSGVSFTHDGTAALVALRDEQGLIVLDVTDNGVSTARDRISTGVGPYDVDVSSDGNWAVVSNVGLAGLVDPGRIYGDVDTLTLIDVSHRPFRAVQHITVPSIPEGVAISPDGRWIAAQVMDGSNLTPDNPGRNPLGRIVLFEIRDGEAVKTADLPGGEGPQGIAFSADSETLLAQFNVERQIAIFKINGGDLLDTGERIPTSGGPASLRTKPR